MSGAGQTCPNQTDVPNIGIEPAHNRLILPHGLIVCLWVVSV